MIKCLPVQELDHDLKNKLLKHEAFKYTQTCMYTVTNTQSRSGYSNVRVNQDIVCDT